ncbi:hypothetical protein ACTXT7_012377 [Hymenolepis weldensis]
MIFRSLVLRLRWLHASKTDVINAVKAAFDVGYGNEKEIDQAITKSMKKHNLKHEDIFVTSKLWCDRHDPKVVK